MFDIQNKPFWGQSQAVYVWQYTLKQILQVYSEAKAIQLIKAAYD